ncbi:hypothetical protein AB0G67_39740 [Streptomyces sp. NPDC021056]|uniref:hypothetical protein n=1 Tax=Streptomyces sp. NPDC021056 TaxID=3155012 RepID=UPI0033F828FF
MRAAAPSQPVGVDWVLFSSDYPFEFSAGAVAFVRSAPYTSADLARIAHGNADRQRFRTRGPDSRTPRYRGGLHGHRHASLRHQGFLMLGD